MTVKFNVKSGKSKLSSRYFIEEKSFGLIKPISTISLVLGHQYLTLEVDFHSRNVIGLSGYFDTANCHNKTIHPISDALDRIIEVEFDGEVESGVAYTLSIIGASFYDSKARIIEIGEYAKASVVASIGGDLIVGINENRIVYLCVENV